MAQTTYVIFDGDQDKWAYAYMLGWAQNKNIDFNLRDAHDLTSMTGRAQDEAYVKSNLRQRMRGSDVVVVLVGASTKNLYRYVRWELELALELGIPIIAANLNEMRQLDPDRCPAIIRDKCVVHVPFKLAAVRHALKNWPTEFKSLQRSVLEAKGARHYGDEFYRYNA